MANTSYNASSDEYTRGLEPKGVIGNAIAWVVITTVAVILRFYARWLAKVKLALDDCLVLISYFIQIALYTTGICFVVKGGVGKHRDVLEEVDPAKIEEWARYVLAIEVLYYIAVMPPKLAILELYRKVFTLQYYLIKTYIMMGVTVATSIANVITALNQCHPLAYQWDKTIVGGSCININTFLQWSSLPNIVTDLVMLLLPVPIVWNLHAALKVKVGLTFIFALGVVGLATSIARFITFLDTDAIVDGTWTWVHLINWTMIEPDAYLLVACLLTFRPIVHRLSSKNRHKNNRRSIHYNANETALRTSIQHIPLYFVDRNSLVEGEPKTTPDASSHTVELVNWTGDNAEVSNIDRESATSMTSQHHREAEFT